MELMKLFYKLLLSSFFCTNILINSQSTEFSSEEGTLDFDMFHDEDDNSQEIGYLDDEFNNQFEQYAPYFPTTESPMIYFLHERKKQSPAIIDGKLVIDENGYASFLIKQFSENGLTFYDIKKQVLKNR
jgi:hypothetical protein